MSAFAVSVLVKATVVVLAALGCARLARRHRAAVRHLVLAAGFAVLLILPLASLLAPAVRVAIPIAASKGLVTPSPDAVPEMAAVGSSSAVGSNETPSTAQWQLPGVAALMAGAWLAGVAIFLLPVAAGLWQMQVAWRSALPWRDGQSLVNRLARDIGIERTVDALVTERVRGPMTCGVGRPAIVLPADAQTWPAGDVERAIVHELEHVRAPIGSRSARPASRAPSTGCTRSRVDRPASARARSRTRLPTTMPSCGVRRSQPARTGADRLRGSTGRARPSPVRLRAFAAPRHGGASRSCGPRHGAPRRTAASRTGGHAMGGAGGRHRGAARRHHVSVAYRRRGESAGADSRGRRAGRSFRRGDDQACQAEDAPPGPARGGMGGTNASFSTGRMNVPCVTLEQLIYLAYAGSGAWPDNQTSSTSSPAGDRMRPRCAAVPPGSIPNTRSLPSRRRPPVRRSATCCSARCCGLCSRIASS